MNNKPIGTVNVSEQARLNGIFEGRIIPTFFTYPYSEDGIMERMNVYAFFALGAEFATLNEIIEGASYFAPTQKPFNNIFSVIHRLHRIADSDKYFLKTTKEASEKLAESLEKLFPADPQELPPVDTKFTKKQADKIARGANLFDVALATELNNSHYYYLAEDSIYSVDALMEKAENLIDEEVRSVLPDGVGKELRQFGRCFAFQLDTAAGFHLIRALEHVLTHYLISLGGELGKKKERSWGNFLNKINALGADKRIVKKWRDLKDNHRDDLMHPEIVLSKEEVSSLISDVHIIIRGTVADIMRKTDPTNPLVDLYPALPEPNDETESLPPLN